MKSRWTAIASGVCLTLGSVFASAQQASGHEGHHPDAAEQQKSAPQPTDEKGMMAGCAMMQKHMGEMRAAQDVEQAKLDGLVKTMNEAAGPAKVDAIAAVVTEMVNSAKTLRAAHEDAMHQMMQHMSEHMMPGADPAKKSEMMMCPMMKSHATEESGHGEHADGAGAEKAPQAPSADEHAGHHQN